MGYLQLLQQHWRITGIGLIGSIVAGAGMGLAQYTLDSAVFHDDFSWSGALISIGLGA